LSPYPIRIFFRSTNQFFRTASRDHEFRQHDPIQLLVLHPIFCPSGASGGISGVDYPLVAMVASRGDGCPLNLSGLTQSKIQKNIHMDTQDGRDIISCELPDFIDN
jgi:hypothetical protein